MCTQGRNLGEKVQHLCTRQRAGVKYQHSCPSGWTLVPTEQYHGSSVTCLSELAERGVGDGELWIRAGGSKSQNMCSLFQTSCRFLCFLEFGVSSMFLDISH